MSLQLHAVGQRHLSATSLLFGCLFACTALSGQTSSIESPMRAMIVSTFAPGVRDTIRAPEASCAEVPSTTRSFCKLVVQLRQADLGNSSISLRAIRDSAERHVLTDGERSAAWWFVLGKVRLILAARLAIAEAGPLQLPGVSYLQGGANALVRALELDSTLVPAAEALAIAPVPRVGDDLFRGRIAALRRSRSALSSKGLAAAARLERDAGSLDSAIALQRRALALGGIDSGVVLLDLAQSLYQHGDPSAGRAALLRGAGTPTEAAKNAYRQELAWVGTPVELTTWDTLSAGARSQFVANFWASRDIAEGRAEGERLIEHYRRVAYALAHFRLTLPQVGRSPALSFSRPMDFSREYRARDEAARSVATNIPHTAVLPPGARAIPDTHSGNIEALGQFVRDSKSIGSESSLRYYRPVQDLVDDRGAIWIRHGPPTKRAASTLGDAIEVWRYELPGRSMVLQFRDADFDGEVEASVLIPTLATLPPPELNEVCALENSLCRMTGRPNELPEPIPLTAEIIREGEKLTTAGITRARDKGRAQIDLATTTDSYHREFSHAVKPTVDIFGLDVASGGSPRLVVGFAIPGEQLASVPTAGRTVYPVRFQLMALNLHSAKRFELDTLRQFVTQATLTSGQFITGVLELPVPAGRYMVSLVVTQSDGRGAVASLGEVKVPGSAPTLSVSDLVLGREGSGVRWNSGATVVPLNPLNAYPKGGTAEVYFQLAGLKVGTSYQTVFEFYRGDDDPKHAPRLRIATTQAAHETRLEVQRTLGLKNLDPGRYRVVLSVSGAGESAKSVAWLTIVK